MRVHWLLPSIMGAMGILFFSLPAEAARLQRWHFDEDGNRLTFSTDEGVQPRAQLLTSPTRIVIDLPDTTFDQSQVEAGEGAIREIRVAQFDETTTRIVIELNSGYTLDPQQVRVQGTASNRWTVQLPEPQRSNTQGTNTNTASGSSNSSDRPEQAEAAARIEDIQITPDGFFIRTIGEVEDIDEDNDKRPPRFTLELEDTVLSSQIERREIEVNQYGVERIELTQVEVDDNDPPVVQITLELEENTSRWQARESRDLGGISLNPRRGEVLTGTNRELRSLTSAPIPVPNQPIPTPEPNQPPTTEIPLPDVSDSNVVIAIDPGHGGHDPGAVGIAGLEEAGIVLDIGQQVADILEEQGVRVLLTRQDDREIDLEPRVQAANQANADLFVSIHANSINLSRPDVNGVETYYYSDAGQRFAQVIHNAVIRGTDSRDRGVRFARFYVLRNTHMPAVLVEVGFVTGEQDADRLSDADFRQRMAESIAAGILEYVQRNF